MPSCTKKNLWGIPRIEAGFKGLERIIGSVGLIEACLLSHRLSGDSHRASRDRIFAQLLWEIREFLPTIAGDFNAVACTPSFPHCKVLFSRLQAAVEL